MIKPKLLAPAGNFVSLRSAIDAGCDEIYFGVKGFNMRANADNFSVSEVKKVVDFCHKNNVKAYLTLNTIVYENELKKVENIIKKAKLAKVDAVIAWDMAVIKSCIKHKIKIHLSTQNSISNFQALSFYESKIPNLTRVILARECLLQDITDIIKKIRKNKLKIQIETFIHGAMCVSVSGRCFLSQELFGRSANRGDCLQPCRRKYLSYKIRDPEEGHELYLGEDYILSPKDLCAMPFIDKLIESGIAAFKIEGRNRNPEYVQKVVRSYRKIIDYYCDKKNEIKKDPKQRKRFELLKKKLVTNMKEVYNRDFSNGFYLGKPIDWWSKAYGSQATRTKSYIGKVLNYYPKISVAEVKLESGDIKVNNEIMFQGPTTGVFEQTLGEMQIEKKFIQQAKKGQRVGVKVVQKVRKNDKMFRMK